LSEEQVVEIFECIKDDLRAGYANSDNPWAKDYLNWGRAASAPAAPGVHGGRFLNTTVNEIGYRECIIFFMEKVAAGGEADKYGNWFYSVIKSSGKPQKISQKFCHDCHGAYSDQDSMGYPAEEVRLLSE